MQTVTVGNIDIVSLTDGRQAYPAASIYPKGGDTLLRFRDRLTADGGIELSFGCFLIRADGQTILVDTGNGPERNGQLLEELETAGVRREDISVVVFTHLHGDHTGWNIDRGSGRPLFPAARYLVPRADWEHYRTREQVPASFTCDVVPLEAMGCLELIEGERSIGPSVRTLSTPGHTPGHTSLVIVSGEERAAVIGDVVLSTIDVEEPTLVTSFDNDQALAVQTRLVLLERLEKEQAVVAASHLQAPGLGRVVRIEQRFAWRGISVGPRGT